MTNTIDLTEDTAEPAKTTLIPEAKASGYLGFYRSNSAGFWCLISIIDPVGVPRDLFRTPYPLAETRERLIEEAKKYLPNGGELKIVRIQL